MPQHSAEIAATFQMNANDMLRQVVFQEKMPFHNPEHSCPTKREVTLLRASKCIPIYSNAMFCSVLLCNDDKYYNDYNDVQYNDV